MQPFRVLLINPSSERFYVPSAPLGLAYLAGALPDGAEAEGLDLNVLKWLHGLDDNGIDATFDRYLNQSLQHHVAPGLIGITVYEETLPQTERLVAIAKRYGIPTVAGGIYPTMFAEAMPDTLDWVIRGEGETAFRLLVEALIKREHGFSQSVIDIPGVLYHDPQGGWRESKVNPCGSMRKEVRPRRDIFAALNMGFRYYSARVVSSSGCPYACKFCANSEYARREWIPRPVEDVLDEIDDTLRDDAISEISFSDDQFLGFTPEHYRRARLLLEAIESLTRLRNLRIN
ncbi:MAG TPA: cobalamin-dependent protein, partial [Bacillota bacterium]|nr:cobalamin-dependent protein [Bacillota bacterium]